MTGGSCASIEEELAEENESGTSGDSCKKAKLQAGIKPTALCSAIDKENLIVSQMVTYLICDELRFGFKSAYEQS